jgi:uncharacterized OB-fold protein
MSDRLEHPTLYEASDAGPILLGHRCGQCGLAGFPRQSLGCESCGADGARLTPISLDARGKLASFAVVHRHAGKDIAAPFIMGEIALDDGPLIRCTLSAETPSELTIGQRMIGVLEHNPLAGADVRELRFKPEQAS